MPPGVRERAVDPESWSITGLCLVGLTGFLAWFVLVGADTHWLVAMGDVIRATGSVPDGIPFAAMPTEGWPNALVLAQWTLSLVDSWGPWALPLAQLTSTAVALVTLAVGARRMGASDRGTALVLLGVVAGSLATFAIARLQMLSLVPFALLLLWLRSEAERPSRRIWLVPLLVVLWTNLHGAVLLGVCVTGAYLIFSRLRLHPWESVAVGMASLVALLITPAGLATSSYYLGVMGNQAAVRADGLWARPSLTEPLDVMMLVAAFLLVGTACRRRLPLWELVVILGLAAATLMAARHGVWLLMFAAGPAALGLASQDRKRRPRRGETFRSAGLVVACCLAVTTAIVISRGDEVLAEDPAVVEALAAAVGDRVVLAPEPLVEALAVAGVRVWAVNPIDAFDTEVQVAYLDFLVGDTGMELAIKGSDAVVVAEGSAADQAVEGLAGFEVHEIADGWTLYLRR